MGEDKNVLPIDNIARDIGGLTLRKPSTNSDELMAFSSKSQWDEGLQSKIDCLILNVLRKEDKMLQGNSGGRAKEKLSLISSKYLHKDILKFKGVTFFDVKRSLLSLEFLLEPWLRWVAQYESFKEMSDLNPDMLTNDETNVKELDDPKKLLLHPDTPHTYRWFAASVAAENGHKQMVLDLIDQLQPDGEEREHWDSWFYIIWRFLAIDGYDKTNGGQQWRHFAHNFESYDDKWTFLHFAAAHGDLTCMEKLLSVENVDSTTHRDNYTPLHLACYHDNASIVTLLVRHHAAVSKEDKRGRTPLHYACERGCLDSVKALLERGHSSKILEAKDRDGMTPLHLAACRGQREVVRELLSKSERPDVRCESNVMDQKIFISRVLRQRREQVWPRRFTHKNAEIESCFASKANFLEPYNPVQSQTWCLQGFNALHLAIVYRHVDTAMQILQHENKCAKVALTASKDALGLTPIDWAKAMEVNLLFTACSKAGIKHWVEDEKVGTDQDKFTNSSKGKGVEDESNTMPINFEKAKRLYHKVREAEQAGRKLQWTIDMSEALLSRRWGEARCITSQGLEDKIKIKGSVWDHLERAMSYILDFAPTSEYRRSLIQKMLVELVKGEAFSDSSSAMQKCLLWAIQQEMVDLVKAIVRADTYKSCDLLNVEQGVKIVSGYKNIMDVGQNIETSARAEATSQDVKGKSLPPKSPLEAACEIKGERGSQMVALIEEQKDVKQRLYEERKLYLEYSNTLLVGAVLVAALAFQGWVQTAQGYPGMPLDTTTKGMRRYARCNSLGFFFSMGGFMAGAVGAMPLRSGQLVGYKEQVIQAVSVASLLMALSVACLVVGFASAIVSVQSHRRDMLVSSRFGMAIIFMLSAWFVARLNNLRNVLGLLLELALPTLLKFLTSMLAFWRILPHRTLNRWVLYPLYVRVLRPHARDFTSLVRKRCQPIQRLKSAIEALPESLKLWLDSLNRQLDDIEYQYHQPDTEPLSIRVPIPKKDQQQSDTTGKDQETKLSASEYQSQ